MSADLTLGETVRVLRQRRRLTQQELADTCGFSRSVIANVETDRTGCSIEIARKIANALGVTVGRLLGDEQPPQVEVNGVVYWRTNAGHDYSVKLDDADTS